MMDDIRQALRGLVRSPGFSLVAVVTLALGIGANSAIFSIVDAVVMRPLPVVRDADRVVALVTDTVSYPVYRDFRDGTTAFDGFAGFQQRPLGLTAGARTDVVRAVVASGNYFEVLGITPALGRLMSANDDTPAAPSVAVISYSAWQQRFGGNPGVVGTRVLLNGTPFEIVGVTAAGFKGVALSDSPELWITINAWPRVGTGNYARLNIENRNWGWVAVFGRLRPGVTAGQATAALQVVQDRIRAADRRNPPLDIRLSPLAAASTGLGDSRATLVRFLAMLAGMVGATLLLACANVANLLLVRGARRRREIAIRQAIGASRSRILRLVLAESVILSTVGGIVAVFVAAWSFDLLQSFELPGGVSIATLPIHFDVRTLGMTALLSLATALGFGLLPALRASAAPVVDTLKKEAVAAASQRLRQVLIGVQIAVCLLLLACAGLFVHSLMSTFSANLGFDLDHVAAATVDPSLQRYDAARTQRLYDQARERLLSNPRVVGASWVAILPLSGDRISESFVLDPGRSAPPERGQQRTVRANAVGAGYFQAMGIPILEGRDFAAEDNHSRGPVAVVSRAFARRYSPGASVIGHRIEILERTAEIVGVAEDSTYEQLWSQPVPFVYLPIAQAPEPMAATLVARTPGDARALLPALREALGASASDVPIFDTFVLRDQLAAILMPQRFAATLLTLLGALAMVLAAVGIYGVTAYAVAQRTREIGIRMALGAGARDIARLVLAGVARPVVAGLIVGGIAAVAAGRALGSFLYNVGMLDAASFGIACAGVCAAVLIAALLPSRRAIAIDPAQSLRTE
jgi:predicted permease